MKNFFEPAAVVGVKARIQRLRPESERPNSPTVPEIAAADARELDVERKRLVALIDRAVAGPSGLTTHPHSFFGRLAPQQWSVLMDKHLEYHLRQFGV